MPARTLQRSSESGYPAILPDVRGHFQRKLFEFSRLVLFFENLCWRQHSELSQELLNEVSAAKVCLLDDAKKREYDNGLRQRTAPLQTSPQAPLVAVSPVETVPRTDPAPFKPVTPGRPSRDFRRKVRGSDIPKTVIHIAVSILLFSIVAGLIYYGTTSWRGPEPVQPSAPNPVISTFDSDMEGWVACEGDETHQVQPRFLSHTGNPAGCISFTDPQKGKTWEWRAPRKFLGNKSEYYGLHLRYDLWTSHVEEPKWRSWFSQVRLVASLAGERRELFIPARDVVNPVAGAWTSVSIPLDTSAGWRKFSDDTDSEILADEDEIRAVLGNLVDLRIPGEFSTTRDNGRLDNVVFGME